MSTKTVSTAHGRVNLIGEHTDYNFGFVLPTLIPQKTTVHARRRTDQMILVRSHGIGEATSRLGEETPTKHWSDYAFGVTSILAQTGFRLSGMDLEISSTIPIGSGLSSSAALIVAVMKAIRDLYEFDLEDARIPGLCQRIENEFVGAHVGIMDPMACALARPGFALFVDTRNKETTHIPIPPDSELIVIHSGVSHRNVGGGYNLRRSQCEESARLMGVQSLRDLDISRLADCERGLSKVQFRRTRHVLTENERVLACVKALKAGDLTEAGELFDASHRSMRDDFEVSIPEVDHLVECVRRQPGVYGARLTGGGFGGSIVALAKTGRAKAAAESGASDYAEKCGQIPVIVVPESKSSFAQ